MMSPSSWALEYLQDVEKLKSSLGESENLSFAAADVEKPESLREALQNARGVIFAASGGSYFSAAKVDHKVYRGNNLVNWVIQGAPSKFARVADWVVVAILGSGYFLADKVPPLVLFTQGFAHI